MIATQETEKLVRLRHELHANPELSGQETYTSKRLLKFLEAIKPDQIIQSLGGNGFALVFKGEEKGKRILFRADMDALPIQEKSALSYASKNAGVAHLCGHDGHSSILAGFALLLNKKRPEKGEVILLFQPAEETGQGAMQVINDPKFENIKPDMAFALHNLPGFERHSVVLREHTFAAASVGIKIHLIGRTAHASQPETGVNPATALAKLMLELEQLKKQWQAEKAFKLLTITHARLGEEAFGTSPGEAFCWVTIRNFEDETLEAMQYQCLDLATKNARENQLDIQCSNHEPFAATINEPLLMSLVENAAAQNQLPVHKLKNPFRWSEDFGQFGRFGPITLFGIGSGKNHPALHNPDYDFPDELIPTGIAMFDAICRQITNS
ncbi:MAG: amidohydrolase [Bacteroidales bacterium]|jgi:amidohydrolase|nr:amidohydrolase [Bacteroidales bacterium]HOI32365.1 amidohydrolase [Bacteroidales bacterium]